MYYILNENFPSHSYFQIPAAPNLYIDPINTSLLSAFRLTDKDGKPFTEGKEISIVNEPLIGTIQKLSLYAAGKHITSYDNLTYINYLNKIQLDQNYLNSALWGTNGFAMDDGEINSTFLNRGAGKRR